MHPRGGGGILTGRNYKAFSDRTTVNDNELQAGIDLDDFAQLLVKDSASP